MSTYTEADLVTLRQALASGVRAVQHGDKVVTYRSMQEIREAIQTIEAAIGTAQPVRAFRPVTDRGFR